MHYPESKLSTTLTHSSHPILATTAKMAGYTPLPPTILHSTNPITHAEAHSLLSAFLERANNDAAYRPDSTLTEHGPQSTSTATKSDLTLHHLNRIKLGLEGKALGVEDLENGFLDSLGGK